jgi:hypothetical protein
MTLHHCMKLPTTTRVVGHHVGSTMIILSDYQTIRLSDSVNYIRRQSPISTLGFEPNLKPIKLYASKLSSCILNAHYFRCCDGRVKPRAAIPWLAW